MSLLVSQVAFDCGLQDPPASVGGPRKERLKSSKYPIVVQRFHVTMEVSRMQLRITSCNIHLQHCPNSSDTFSTIRLVFERHDGAKRSLQWRYIISYLSISSTATTAASCLEILLRKQAIVGYSKKLNVTTSNGLAQWRLMTQAVQWRFAFSPASADSLVSPYWMVRMHNTLARASQGTCQQTLQRLRLRYTGCRRGKSK